MYALPPRIERDRLDVSGMACPDCGGVLRVKREGRDAVLVFECRVSHTYDLGEVLAAKEERLEHLLWASLTAFEELVALLGDLAQRGPEHGETREAVQAYRQRAALARAQVASLRNIIQADRPVDLSPAEPGSR